MGDTMEEVETKAEDNKPDDIVEDALERFKRVSDFEANNRAEALDDLKFARLGEQWPQDIRRSRELEGRPCLTINRMPSFIRQVVNDSRQNKPAIKCHPVDSGADPKVADLLNGVIRNIEVSSNADIAYDTAIDFAVTCGIGYFRITTDYAHDDTFDMDIMINRLINPFTVYADPDATEGDGSDWRYCFITEWIDEDDFKVKWPKAEAVDFEGNSVGDREGLWIQEGKIRVAEYWVRDEVTKTIVLLSNGQVLGIDDYEANAEIFNAAGLTVINTRETKSWEVKQHWIGGNQVLETNDWVGTYIPIIPVYGDEINVDGKKYYHSLIRHAKDSQRMFNYWRTTSTELVALTPKTPFIGKVGAFDTDISKWNTANSKSHAFIEYDGDSPPQRQPFAGAPAGALQEALNASDDMKSIIGIYDASLGARSNETSGRAIMARQREGDVSTFHFIDNMTRAIRQAGRILVDLIPKVYDKPRVLRIIGEDKTPKNVQVNQPYVDDKGIEKLYDLTVGKYDVTVEAGASYTSKREEAVTAITELIRSYPPAAPILGDVMVKMMDFPDAEKISNRLKAMLPPQIQKMESEEDGIPPEAQAIVGQMQSQLQQVQQQMQQGMQQFQQMQKENEQLKADKQAEFAKIQSDSQAVMAKIQADLQKAELDNATKLQIAQLGAEAKSDAQQFDAYFEMMKQAVDGIKSDIQLSNANNQQQFQQVQQVASAPKRNAKRKISIVAPSGQTYQGIVEDDVEETE
jgi:hypothetical protein